MRFHFDKDRTTFAITGLSEMEARAVATALKAAGENRAVFSGIVTERADEHQYTCRVLGRMVDDFIERVHT